MPGERVLQKGRLSVAVEGARAGGVVFDGVEILRGLTVSVRDANWGTYETLVDREQAEPGLYRCDFSERGGLFHGQFQLALDDERHCSAETALTFASPAAINRAGFCLLHPIRDIGGTPLTVHHPDGSSTRTAFPARIAPSQPAFDIAGLTHRVGPVTLDIAMQGEVFEMEDQRNWSDASFKTYCRPLAAPQPFAVAAGEVVRQRVSLAILDVEPGPCANPAPARQAAILPQPMLAFEPGLSTPEALAQFPDMPILARIDAQTPRETLALLGRRPAVALEIVLAGPADIDAIARRVAEAGLRPIRVMALPAAYLKSYQPQGTWPSGPKPGEVVPLLRQAFPGVPVGGGSLTNFTEFNRCPPPAAVDFASFGNTAIVHAADDLSVIQTLEALPDIFASAQALCPGRPLHLGLFSIGMRANPYGADVRPNPSGRPTAMARRDRRQETAFAAAYAVAVLALAARAGVGSIALAMPDGDLGAAGRPLAAVLRLAGQLAGQRVETEAAGGIYGLFAGDAHLLANLSGRPCPVPGEPSATLLPGEIHLHGGGR